MPSPRPGANNPRQCSGRTKEEVLANFARYYGLSLAGNIEPEAKQQRMERQADALADSQLWHDNTRAASRPVFEIHGPHLPRYQDDRLRARTGRFGHRISD